VTSAESHWTSEYPAHTPSTGRSSRPDLPPVRQDFRICLSAPAIITADGHARLHGTADRFELSVHNGTVALPDPSSVLGRSSSPPVLALPIPSGSVRSAHPASVPAAAVHAMAFVHRHGYLRRTAATSAAIAI
jgi:hypothetical protein